MTPVPVGAIEVDELDGWASTWDRAVDATPGADEFCAASPWCFAAARHLGGDPPVVLTDGRSFAGMRGLRTEDGTRLLVGLDPIWGFATPFVGHPVAAARLLAARLAMEDHDVALVTGQTEDGVALACLADALGTGRRLLRGPTEQRLRADLSDGVEAWFARRSPRFRQRIRRLDRDAADAGIEVVDASALPPDEALDRVLVVEAGSWKGREGTGLASASLAGFYRDMAWRLAARDQLRLLLARRGGEDVAFVLGGVRGRTYRGLQLSHRADVDDLGLGHVLQWHQIRRLEGTGIDTYDLGMDMPYKRRWADRVDETLGVIVAR